VAEHDDVGGRLGHVGLGVELERAQLGLAPVDRLEHDRRLLLGQLARARRLHAVGGLDHDRARGARLLVEEEERLDLEPGAVLDDGVTHG
jgi:hypothetical protein